MHRLQNTKLIILILIPLLLIPLASFAYAHFTEEAEMRYSLHVAFPDIKITSYKVLSKWDDCLIKKWFTCNTLTIQTRVFPGWYAWIGLVLHNEGKQPCLVYAPNFNVYDPDNVWKYFTHREYFYGPYSGGDFATTYPPVWGGLKWWQLPPKAEPTEPPVLLEPCHKLIIWIKLKFAYTCPGGGTGEYSSGGCYDCCYKFKIKISISVPCTPPLKEYQCWTWPPIR